MNEQLSYILSFKTKKNIIEVNFENVITMA